MAPERPPNAAKMAILVRFWKLLGSIFNDSGRLLGCQVEYQKTWERTYILFFIIMFWGGFEVGNGSQIEENPAKMDMLSPGWAVLGDLGCKLGCGGRSWKEYGAEWCDEERQDEPPEVPRREGPRGVGGQFDALRSLPLRGVPTTHTLLLLADKLTTSSDSKTSK